jgi:hypothetical protein
MADEKNLEDIKRLLILLLVKLNATSDEIATALQVEASGVRKMIPFRQVKRIIKNSDS